MWCWNETSQRVSLDQQSEGGILFMFGKINRLERALKGVARAEEDKGLRGWRRGSVVTG